MAVKANKGSVNQLLILFFGLVFVLASILIYMYILKGIFGRFSVEALIPDSKVINKVVYGGEANVAILYSQYTENMLPEGSTWLSDNINTWKKFLGDSKFKYDIIRDEDIELGKHFNYSLLILPGSKALSDRETVQIKKYVDQGGSVFATSGIASYSSDGKWRGWEFFSEIFGLKFSKEIEKDEITKVHTLRGNLPLTASIPAGYPLKVATWDRPMAVEVLDPRTVQVSFWYNYRLEDGLVREEIKKSAGIVYGSYGYGKFVWMGFEINSVIGVQEDYIYFDKLFRNSLDWLTYRPIAYARDWPTGYDAAAVIMPYASNNFSNTSNLLDVLKSEKVPATFFVDPFEAEQNKELTRKLAKSGEVGAIVDIGYLASVDDTINSLNHFGLQKEKLGSAKSSLEKIINRPVAGAIPYYGLYDQNTIQALAQQGYKYIVTDSLTDRSVPKAIIRGDKMLLSLTKTARDDYEVIRDFGLTDQGFQRYTYQEDIDRIYFEGGMYLMKLHSNYQLQRDNVNVVKDLIKDLKSKKFWITTAEEIHNWWLRRNYAEVRIEKRGDTRIALTVSNPGEKTINDLVLEVFLNDNAENIKTSSEIIGTKKAKYSFDPERKMLYMYVDQLSSGESRIYYIDYDRTNS